MDTICLKYLSKKKKKNQKMKWNEQRIKWSGMGQTPEFGTRWSREVFWPFWAD